MVDRRNFICHASQWALAGAGLLGASRLRGQAAFSSLAAAPAAAPPLPPSGPITGPGSLRAHAAARGLLYGSAVDIGLLRNDAAYRQLLIDQCGIVVAENAMKWAAVHTAADRYDFSQADELVAFAEQHGIKVRGHNLCWHEALPGWFASTVTQQNAAHYLTDHIRTVAGRYKGRLRSWDVVNEAISPGDGKPDGLRDSAWYRLLGPGYIELAFRTARAADPHALLTYNDYGIEYDHPASFIKRAAVLALLRRLKAAGVPIDAVGVQSHLDATTSGLGPGISEFVAAASALGLKVFITELDVNDDNLAPGQPAALDAAVAGVYGEYVTAMVAKPAVTDVLTWGLSDNHTWLNSTKTHKQKYPGREERALPFDDAYQPTAAFYALLDALGSHPVPGHIS